MFGCEQLAGFPQRIRTRKALAHEVEVFIDKELGTDHSVDRPTIATLRVTTDRGNEVRWLLKQMVERTGTGRNVHVLMLDPKGKVIM